MIKTIKNDAQLCNYTTHQIEDAGIEVAIDDTLDKEQYIGIKIDDYYMGLNLQGEHQKQWILLWLLIAYVTVMFFILWSLKIPVDRELILLQRLMRSSILP